MDRSIVIVLSFITLNLAKELTPVERQIILNPSTGNLTCPHLFTGNTATGTCYKVVRIQATWPEALAYCQAYNSRLAIIESAAEETYLESMLKRDGASLSSHEFWLGGADIMSEGEWQWAMTQEKNMKVSSSSGLPLFIPELDAPRATCSASCSSAFSYQNWDDREPSNSDGEEHCLETSSGRNYRWNDDDCEDHNYFVCETKSP